MTQSHSSSGSPESSVPSEPAASSARPRLSARRRLKWILLGGPVLAVGGMLAGRAWAHGKGGPFRGCLHAGEGEAAVASCVEGRIDKMLDRLDATDGQRAQVKAIARRTLPEVGKLHASHKNLREAMATAMSRDVIDPAEIERLRRDAVTTLTSGSEIASRAMIEMAQALSPEQRKKVAAFMKRHHGARHGGPF